MRLPILLSINLNDPRVQPHAPPPSPSFNPQAPTILFATPSPLHHAPVTVPSATKGAVCSPANQRPLSGQPLLMTSTSSSPLSSPTWKLAYAPNPASSSFAHAVARTWLGPCSAFLGSKLGRREKYGSKKAVSARF